MININDIDCWIVNLKPLDNPDILKDFQLRCIDKKVFGIGWYSYGFNGTLADNKDVFLKKKSGDKVYKAIKKAVDSMDRIKENDLVIMRLRDAHYYIGQVSERAFYSCVFEDDYYDKILSWMCSVCEWVEFETDEHLPSEIVGRLSQRRQPTISRVANYRQKLLIAAAFNLKSKQKIDGVSKINLTIDNFARSLNYMELEDIVCSYIYTDIQTRYPESNYMLLPSSCKVSRPLYEFVFVCQNEQPITCQVKNDAVIDVEKHIDDNYKRIYLFSDKGYSSETTRHSNMTIITREQLYSFLIDNSKYMHEKLSAYYTFDETGIDV